jgi:hypothetical protein
MDERTPVARPTDAELAEVVAHHRQVKAMLENPLEVARVLVRLLEDRQERPAPDNTPVL